MESPRCSHSTWNGIALRISICHVPPVSRFTLPERANRRRGQLGRERDQRGERGLRRGRRVNHRHYFVIHLSVAAGPEPHRPGPRVRPRPRERPRGDDDRRHEAQVERVQLGESGVEGSRGE